MPGELNQTHFNLNTHQQKLDNSLQTLFKLEVPALFSEQLRVTTLLNYLAVVHDYYLIKTRQASQAVGDHQHGFLAHDFRQQMQDLAFGGGIQTFCRFIQQHQRRIVEQRAGDGKAGAVRRRKAGVRLRPASR